MEFYECALAVPLDKDNEGKTNPWQWMNVQRGQCSDSPGLSELQKA